MTNLRSWLIAQIYDKAMQRAEQKFLARWRQELLQHAQGQVLEIGAGTGLNIPYYPKTISRLVLSEPDPCMVRQLKKKIDTLTAFPITTENTCVEDLPFPNQSFDTVVSTFVLCSVHDLTQGLQQIHRVLKSGGRLIFLEHIANQTNPTILKWQKWCEPAWKCLTINCHLTRQTLQSIQQNKFQVEDAIHEPMPGVPALVRQTIRGQAMKPNKQ